MSCKSKAFKLAGAIDIDRLVDREVVVCRPLDVVASIVTVEGARKFTASAIVAGWGLVKLVSRQDFTSVRGWNTDRLIIIRHPHILTVIEEITPPCLPEPLPS